MKRFALFALLIFAAAGLSVTATHAFAAPTAGCNPQIWDMQQHHADALRVRDKAYAMQTVKRNDPTLGVTCFDQALGLTSRLGAIFSDTLSPPTMPAFPGAPTTFPSFGAGSFLASDLSTVVEPMLGADLGNFTGVLSSFPPLNSLSTGFLSSFVSGILNPLMAPINSAISAFTSATSTFNSLISAINSIMTLLPGLPSIGVPPIIGTLNGIIASVKSMINSAIGALTSAITSAMSGVMSALMGSATSMNCPIVQGLWDDSTADANSIVGQGIQTGSPYFTLSDLVSGGPPAVGTDFLTEIQTATDSGILSTAASDLSTLATPGGISSWPTAPVFPAGATTTQIISGM